MIFATSFLYTLVVWLVAAWLLEYNERLIFFSGLLIGYSLLTAARITKAKYQDIQAKANIPANDKNLILSIMGVETE